MKTIDLLLSFTVTFVIL